MRPIQLSKALTAASANNICLSQTPGGAGNLTLNGALVAAGLATLDTQRVVAIASAGNDTARTFTVRGTDERGTSITEAVAGPNATTVSTVQNFKTVTSISVDAATAGAITVGTSATGSSPAQVLDEYIPPFNTSLFVRITGSVTYTVQYTGDDVFASGFVDGSASWTDHASLTGKSANADSNLAFPASAVRLKITAGTGTATFIIRQAGIVT